MAMKLVRALALALAPLGLAIGSPVAAQNREPVTIGAIEILTGPNNKYGLAIKNGFDLAFHR